MSTPLCSCIKTRVLCSLWTGLHILPSSGCVNVFLQYMFCRNRCSHCKSLTFYCILAQPMLHFFFFFASIPKWTYQETFRFCSFFFFPPLPPSLPPSPLEVTVSANLLVGRHQSSVLQNTNLPLLCSCKEGSALLMQSRCQIKCMKGRLVQWLLLSSRLVEHSMHS